MTTMSHVIEFEVRRVTEDLEGETVAIFNVEGFEDHEKLSLKERLDQEFDHNPALYLVTVELVPAAH